MAIAPLHAQTANEIALHSFAGFPRGANPDASLIRDAAGNFYGTTALGGAGNKGVVFRLNAAGAETVLYSFTGGADGGEPTTGLASDSAGNLYGATQLGGTAFSGVVFRLDAAGTETVLHTFTGGADGGSPNAVTLDAAGNLYGTTFLGGAAGAGVVFKVDAAGNYMVLYSFTGLTDGKNPSAGVVLDSAGNLYGTTETGGIGDDGVVYKLDTAGNESVLYNFRGGPDGRFPGAVIRDSAGSLFGIAGGGAGGGGVVYRLDSPGYQTVLHSFTPGAGGSDLVGSLSTDSVGYLYGTTARGGSAGFGVVYKLSHGKETVLYSFTGGPDGSRPAAGVIHDSTGNLYGTTREGGTPNVGVVYKLDAAGQESVVYTFPGATGGSQPWAGVIRDSAGNFYGTTFAGGTAGAGVVYKVDTAGQETLLHSFTGAADGAGPTAGLISDSAGNLYGTATGGGAGFGVVYKLHGSGHETVLYSFTGGADGSSPQAAVIRDAAGNLYGTTTRGGTAGAGVVYKLDTAGNETVLYNFTGGADGGYPYAGVIQDSAGNFYGTTYGGGAANGNTGTCPVGCGVVYKLDTAGNETVLYSFTGGTDGGYPWAGVIRDSAGNLYGTTYQAGGPSFDGVVYKVDPAGKETVLYTFTNEINGKNPYAGVILDSEGNLYGTTQNGGTSNAGVVYKLNAAGQETVLYNFTAGADGGLPFAGVIRDSAGNLYGTTYGGGASGDGVIFELKPQ